MVKKQKIMSELDEMKKVDLSILRDVCVARISDFKSFGSVTDTRDGIAVFQDNGASILAVAHLDSVQSIKRFAVNSMVINKTKEVKVTNPALDDRLGVYTILYYLKEQGLNYDILLTEGEETGHSTAKLWSPPNGKKYNWIFSFDRARCDVVGYRYEDEYWDEKIESVGMTKGVGSYSDIASMGYCGVKGFNWGCGYQDHHSINAYFFISDYQYMVSGFKDFYDKYHDTCMPHIEKPVVKVDRVSWSRWDDDGYPETVSTTYPKTLSSPTNLHIPGSRRSNEMRALPPGVLSFKSVFVSQFYKYKETRITYQEPSADYTIYDHPDYEWMFDEEYIELWDKMAPHRFTERELDNIFLDHRLPTWAELEIAGNVEEIEVKSEKSIKSAKKKRLKKKKEKTKATDPSHSIKYVDKDGVINVVNKKDVARMIGSGAGVIADTEISI